MSTKQPSFGKKVARRAQRSTVVSESKNLLDRLDSIAVNPSSLVSQLGNSLNFRSPAFDARIHAASSVRSDYSAGFERHQRVVLRSYHGKKRYLCGVVRRV